jgi:amino-acid N-acetyltransferase
MRASDLRGILRYTSQFRDKLFVLGLDSAIVEAANFKNLILDISVLRSVNVKMMIVHGAGHRLKDISQRLGISPTDFEGDGITDEATMEAAMLASSSLSQHILDCLAEADLPGAVANAVTAHPSGIIGGKDQLLTGRAEKIDSSLFTKLLDAGVIPVVPPMGTDGAGQAFRLESNHVAMEVAKVMGASKLIYLGVSNGVADAGRLAAQFSIEEAESFLDGPEAAADPYLKSKMEHMLQACRNGVHRAHLIDAREDEALISELFSNEGVGTMIYANEYEAIRHADRSDTVQVQNIGNTTGSEHG